MNVAIIGGGAAGCFASIELKRLLPEARVTVYEKGRKLLAKVAVTGGGRCNLTNSFREVRSVESVYPRGARLMKRLLREFGNEDVCRWFEREGVRLVTQDDQCVFPVSQDAMEIVGTLTRLMRKEGVVVRTEHGVERIENNVMEIETPETNPRYSISFTDKNIKTVHADVVIVTTGGCNSGDGDGIFGSLGLEFIPPVASLFSLCLPNREVKELMGTVVEDVSVGLAGTKLRASGPLLITHWGMSGPAILRLSSYAARVLHDNGYKGRLSVNWFGDLNEGEVEERIMEIAVRNAQKQLSSAYPERLNSRLWTHLLRRSSLRPDMRWSELGGKGRNRLIATLTSDTYDVDGKNRFKEEFVTCGGVSLTAVNMKTLECKAHPGLYFAGEVLDIDAVTGGFNLQAAWTTGRTVAKSVASAN